jgi:hypothetical protein
VTEVLLLSFDLALGIVVTWWILRFDYRRLDDRRLARSWNDASFWNAVVMFGPLCLPFHFTKTRRSLLGFAIGVGWAVVAFAVISLIETLIALLLGAT